MSEIPPAVKTVLSQQRSLAFGLEAVALDMERMGLSAVVTRAQIKVLHEIADKTEQTYADMPAKKPATKS